MEFSKTMPTNTVSRRSHLHATSPAILAVILVFTLLMVARGRRDPAWDLQPSYVGCRVLAAGQGGHLYSHSTETFNTFRDTEWKSVAGGALVRGEYIGPTYVQTPLWAWLLRPACTTMSWKAFTTLFLLIIVLSTCGIVYVVARFWTPSLFTPVWIGAILLLVAVGQPFREVLSFAQTHMIFMLATVLAIALARRDRPILAGILLACAAAVKITPGYLLLYWLVDRKWKAAGSFIVSSLAIVGLTIAATGVGLFAAFLQNLTYTSNILLIAYNNQSLAAWWEGMRMQPELHDWFVHPLPLGLKVLSLLLAFASCLAGGWFDRQRPDDQPPYGAVLALLGATAFTPISWSHYAVILIIPVMLLLQRYLTERKRIWLALALAVYALNLKEEIGFRQHILFTLVRSHFYAMVLAIIAMAICIALRGQRPLLASHDIGAA